MSKTKRTMKSCQQALMSSLILRTASRLKSCRIVNLMSYISGTCGFIVLVVTLSMIQSSTAQASATACKYTSSRIPLNIKGQKFKVPKGLFCHEIIGKRKHIKTQSAVFKQSLLFGAGAACNWRIDFVYLNTKGKGFRDRGKTNYTCNQFPRRIVRKDKHLKHYGKSCAQLYIGGKKISTQCHNITKGFRI